MIAKQAFEVVVDLNNRFAIQDSTFMLQIINQENNCIIAYNTSIIQQYKLHDRHQKRSKMNSNYGSKIENAKAQSCKGKDGKVEEWNEHRMHGKTHFEGTLILTSTKVCNLQTFTLISHSILKVVKNSLTLCYHLHDSHGCTIFHQSKAIFLEPIRQANYQAPLPYSYLYIWYTTLFNKITENKSLKIKSIGKIH